MTRLPYYEKAIIDPLKIRDYILSTEHALGRFKAAFFNKMGYTKENWEQFLYDIRNSHLALNAEPIEKTIYGQKYKIDGAIKGPNGKIIICRSIWIILEGENIPRFITIYPVEGKNEV